MSAIATPFLHSSALPDAEPVNAETLRSFKTQDIPAGADSTEINYNILFVIGHLPEEKVTWKFGTDMAARDAAYAAILAAVSTAV